MYAVGSLGRWLIACGLLALLLSPSTQGAPRGGAYPVPVAIASDCSADVTQSLLDWIATVPDGSVLDFADGACYRIDGTLAIDNRSGLDFEGNGATFRALAPPADGRSIWRVVDSRGIELAEMTIEGSYTRGGSFAAKLQHAHAIEVRRSSVVVTGVTMSDVAGDCIYFGQNSTAGPSPSSGFVRDSSCTGTGRNAVSVVAGSDIVVQHVRTTSIGYDVFDVEPNAGTGTGSTNVKFDANVIGSYAMNAYSIVGNGPIRNQSFTNNRVVGEGLKVAVAVPTRGGFRPRGVTVAGNSSDEAQAPAAINVDDVDGLTITGNHVPTAGGPMAAVTGSCDVTIAGNAFPGGSIQALVHPTVCSFSPASGRPGTIVTVRGSGFADATRVAVGHRPACFTVRSSGRLTVTIPAAAKNGSIAVRTPAGTAESRTSLSVIRSGARAGCIPSR
jgi:hypothetical protein